MYVSVLRCDGVDAGWLIRRLHQKENFPLERKVRGGLAALSDPTGLITSGGFTRRLPLTSVIVDMKPVHVRFDLNRR